MKIFENLDLQDLENEIWKDILNYEGDYRVSNIGRVKSFKYDKINGKIRKQHKDSGGHFQVNLYKNGKSEPKLVHRLVFEVHKEKLKEGCDIHHISEDEEDNFVENLESKPHGKHTEYHHIGKCYSEESKIKMSETRKEKFKNGEINQKGESNHNHKLAEEQVIQIKILLKEEKLNNREIGELFGVKSKTISDIKLGKTWSHIEI
jgi:predicted XRE-type DNA-binding protein